MYGQERIKRELELLIPEIDGGRNVNILLVAPSGHGKTTIAYQILNHFGFDKCEISMPPQFLFSGDKRIHFLDEIQELKNPETLYPFMDSGQYVIILATNELGSVKEPVVNRCITFLFEPYTDNEIRAMIRETLQYPVSLEIMDAIAVKCFGNPRVVKNICMRLSYIFRQHIPASVDELDTIMEDIMAIYKNGLNPLEQRYLDYLKDIGGHGSLSLLSYGTHLDKATIMRDIEPHLLYLNKISISSKGRSLIEQPITNTQATT